LTNEYPPDMGGVSKSSGRVVHFLHECGFDIHVFAPVYVDIQTEFNSKPEIVDGIKVYRVPNIKNSNNFIKPFFQAISEVDIVENFDVFHGFFLFMAYPCLLAAEKKHKPVIASFRGIDALWMMDMPFSVFAKEILKKASWITSVSSESLKEACKIYDIAGKSSFIFNSISTKSSYRWKLTPENKKVIGTVSTFREKKNIPLLLESYAGMDKGLREHLLLVGDFWENKKIDYERKNIFEKLIEQYNVKNEVTITGYVDNLEVAKYLMRMNVFVLSSNHEGLPNAIMEAASIGLPIVSTSVDGVKDIIEDGKNALLVPPENMMLMKQAIEEIVRDEKLAYKLSKGALELNEKLSPEAEKQEWFNLYCTLLEENS